jgi:AAA family ATP:ADP antiporter
MNFINIKSKEKFPALILFVMFFSIVAASITGSTIKDSVFLIYFEKSFLPIMYVIIAITMTAVIHFYKVLSYQKDQTNVIISTSLTFLVLVLFFKNSLYGWFIPFFYVLIEIITILSIMQFWVLAGEIFNPRQAKRIFTFILAGGSFAGISAGFGIKPFTAFYGTSNLIYLTIFFILITILMSVLIKPYRGSVYLEVKRIQPQGSLKINKMSSYTKHIALLIALSSFISKIIDYQFKMTASGAYPSEAELVNFFGIYYASTGFFTLIMQFFVTGLLLNRFGILAGLLFLPFAVLLGSMGFVLVGTLSAVYLTKFSDQVIKFSINNTTQEILWLPLSPAYKKQIKPTIDGSLKSIFEGLAGIFIFVIIYFNIIPESKIHLLSIITILFTILWLWNSFKLKYG